MTYSHKLAAHYLQVAQLSIGEDAFSGSDIRSCSEYELLESELGKATALHETAGTDWEKVGEISEAILRSQSKDLRVAAWLTWSLYQRESFAGLQAGLGMLRYLC